MKFSEILSQISSAVDGLMTKDTPTETIAQIGKVKEQLTELGKAHEQTLVDYGDLKDKYIEMVKNYGTGKAPANEVETEEDVSLEEIGAEIISNRGK